MENKENLEFRMYGFVNYNLSDIQKGIQFGHAVVEYGLEFQDDVEYQEWARRDKTFIILNGGTTNNNPNNLGTLNSLYHELNDNHIKIGEFHEPDLGDQLTAVVFIVDDRVFDKVNWPDFIEDEESEYHITDQFNYWRGLFSDDVEIQRSIIFLRNLLDGKKLA